MKKFLFMIVLLGVFALYAEKVQIVGMPNLRAEPNAKAAITPAVFDVIDTYADWYKVKIMSGTQEGEIGYMYRGTINFTNNTIGGQGAALREKPSSASRVLTTILAGTSISIIAADVIWYKISLGWIYKSGVEIMK